MALSNADLIIHPIRFRIMRTLVADAFTTQEIADRLRDVPKSSIYRHLRTLLQAELVCVSDTKLIRGIQEKRYRLAQLPYLEPDDIAGLSVNKHLHYFTTYLLTVLQDFSNYLDASETIGAVEMELDRAGYTEILFDASPEELDILNAELNKQILKLQKNSPGKGRTRRKLAIVSHPIRD